MSVFGIGQHDRPRLLWLLTCVLVIACACVVTLSACTHAQPSVSTSAPATPHVRGPFPAHVTVAHGSYELTLLDVGVHEQIPGQLIPMMFGSPVSTSTVKPGNQVVEADFSIHNTSPSPRSRLHGPGVILGSPYVAAAESRIAPAARLNISGVGEIENATLTVEMAFEVPNAARSAILNVPLTDSPTETVSFRLW